MFKCMVCEDTGIEKEIISTDKGVLIREYFCSDCEYGQKLYEQYKQEKRNKTIKEYSDLIKKLQKIKMFRG